MRSYTITAACAVLGVSRVTLHRYLKAAGFTFPAGTEKSHTKYIPTTIVAKVQRLKAEQDAQTIRHPFAPSVTAPETNVLRLDDEIDAERIRKALEAIETLQRLHPGFFREHTALASFSPSVLSDTGGDDVAPLPSGIQDRVPIPVGWEPAKAYSERHGLKYEAVRTRMKRQQIDHRSGNFWNGRVQIRNLITERGIEDFHRIFRGTLGCPCSVCGYQVQDLGAAF